MYYVSGLKDDTCVHLLPGPEPHLRIVLRCKCLVIRIL